MPRAPLARHCGVLCLILLGTCSAATSAATSAEAELWAGRYKWFAPAFAFGDGRLDLCNDGTYHLSLTAPQDDGHQQLRGTWSMGPEGSWGSGIVTLTIREPATTAATDSSTDSATAWPPVTSLLALLNHGNAEFLGINGVIDLNQSW